MHLPGHATGAPAVASNQNGVMQLFVHSTDNRLRTSWQGGPSQAFGGWADMGFEGQLSSDPTAATNANGVMQVFVRGPALGSFTTSQTGPNQGFGGWANMGLPN
jgi:hypothetical protein